uniref:Phage repressor protein C, contains Cro/C1-type HTH and peptisase s24 domains n=1 Tax=Candidatus Kentrum sp. UNK TaxID=2126344 RepID=A0A451ANW0_9GAMM|nr:MAG: Phage repressor protein C, contains Cro/C1-type HTH and peptisase s24 domains [Candidatus Kentron sp. UNK]VFK72922.1 MAG: Phage repressor protein C, contains Cro/C1-type HTH and peptisase s24 domains [Candidatus Kentron sp. UNK]
MDRFDGTDTIGGRLRAIRDAIRSSQRGLSSRLGIPLGSLRKYESGEQIPGGEAIRAFARVGVNLHWVLTGEGSMMLKDQAMPLPERGREELNITFIPFYDANVSSDAEITAIERWPFETQWLDKELNGDTRNLFLMHIRGKDMEPTLCDRDVVMVERMQQPRISRAGIHVLRLDGNLQARRLQQIPGHIIRVHSDNKVYTPFEFSLLDIPEDLEIIGKVIWFARKGY